MVSIRLWTLISVMSFLTKAMASHRYWLQVCSCCLAVFGLMSYSLTLGTLDSTGTMVVQQTSIAQRFLPDIATALSWRGGICLSCLLSAVLLLVMVVTVLVVIARIIAVVKVVAIVIVVVGIIVMVMGSSTVIKLSLVIITSLS